jgi:hypothetical protein
MTTELASEPTLLDILDIVLIPIVVAVIALLWSNIQARYRRKAFQDLIFRELKELSPWPEHPAHDKKWYEHQTKEFVHQKILKKTTENRDFILSLDPTLVYIVTQLWNAIDPPLGKGKPNPDQWLWYISEISNYAKSKKYDRKHDIDRCYNKWRSLLEAYKIL